MIKFIKIIGICIVIFIFLLLTIYRYKHPEKTETQLTIDLLKGKVFKYYGMEKN